MAYRTEINGTQIFGNNEYYPEWFDFIRSKGIEIGKEYQYEGVIDDFMEAMEVCERIVLRLDAERCEKREKLMRHMRKDDEEAQAWLDKRAISLFDLTRMRREVTANPEKPYAPHLFDELYDLVEYGYLFIPMALFKACRQSLILDPKHPTRFRAYKLKPGHIIHVHAG